MSCLVLTRKPSIRHLSRRVEASPSTFALSNQNRPIFLICNRDATQVLINFPAQLISVRSTALSAVAVPATLLSIQALANSPAAAAAYAGRLTGSEALVVGAAYLASAGAEAGFSDITCSVPEDAALASAELPVSICLKCAWK